MFVMFVTGEAGGGGKQHPSTSIIYTRSLGSIPDKAALSIFFYCGSGSISEVAKRRESPLVKFIVRPTSVSSLQLPLSLCSRSLLSISS